jgi:hypothetical protein
VIGELLYIADDFEDGDPAVGDFMWMLDAYEDIHEGFAEHLRKRAEFLDYLAERGDVE